MYLPKDKVRALVTAAVVSVIVGILVILYTDFPVPAVAVGIIAVIFIYFSRIVSKFKKRILKSLDILNVECNPKAFLKEIDELLAVCGNKKQEIQLLVNKSAGLYWSGDFKKCLKLLQGIDERSINNDILKAVYHINIASCKLLLGDIEGAESVLCGIKNENAFITKAKEQMKYNISVEKGEFEGAEGFYKKMYESSSTKLEKCFAKYCLVRVYLNEDNKEDAKFALKYVADNASSLYFYKSAKEMYKLIK